MKKTLLVAALSVSAFSAFSTAHASNGTINFTGKVSDVTCTVENGTSGDFTVALSTVSKNQLAASGATAGRVPFDIQVTGCGAEGGNISAYFESGPNVNLETGNLVNTAASGANNVEIQITNSQGEAIAIKAAAAGADGAQANAEWIPLTGGSATINYGAQYYATGAATAGEVIASVQYTMIYQ